MNTNYGLIIEPPKETDYVLGGAVSLGGTVLQENGQWNEYLPDNEIQNMHGLETYACVSFATTNCIEILEKRVFGKRSNWSDRFLAKMSDTDKKKGNTPNNVAETRRKKGIVREDEYPFDVDTWEKFYAPIPKGIQTLAVGEGAEYGFGYEAVPLNAKSIMAALQYSPVSFSVYAWVKGDDGRYYRPQGESDNHLTVVYGYVEGKYWKAFDSYFSESQVLKKIRWDSLPMMCMRYTLDKNVVVTSAWDRFLLWLRQAIAGYGLVP